MAIDSDMSDDGGGGFIGEGTMPVAGRSCSVSRRILPLDGLLVAVFFAGAVMLGYLSVVVMNHGVFTYMLDDPYIHLAVAEELGLHGHYGVNLDEVSAPCSSVIWPFLLAPFARLGFLDLVPLGICTVAGLATAMVVLGRVRRLLPCEPGDWLAALARAGVTVAFLLATNAIGLVFTGMEHSLQVLLAVCVVEGMLRMAGGSKPGWWFAAAVVAGPWVRYENMALTLAATAMCFLLGSRRQAIVLGAASVAGLLAFSGYLVFLGLSPVPTSITAKSPFGGEAALMAVWHNLKSSLALGRGTLVALEVAFLSGMAMAWRDGGRWRLAAWCLALAGALHLGAGAYGWVNRYEIYILAGLTLGLAGIAGAMVKAAGIRVNPRLAWILVPLVAVVGFPYFLGLITLPIASNNIFEQHYQMHRYVVDYWRKPVAVNDLGYVSYHNDQHVLDLWGLASARALKARMGNEPASWMAGEAVKHDVKLAMIYPSMFAGIPDQWEKVAVLRLSHTCVTPAGPEVSFYATVPESATEIRRTLTDFRKSLPVGVALDILAAAPQAPDPRILEK